MTQKTGKGIFVANADSWVGFYAARSVLSSRRFGKVIVGVQDKQAELVRTLEKEGAEVRQWDVSSITSIEKTLEGVSHLLLTPVTTTLEFAKPTINIIQAAERQDVENLLFWSLAGIEHDRADINDKTKTIVKQFKEIEDRVRNNSDIDKTTTARIGFALQNLFYLSDVIQNRAVLPLPTGESPFAPLNLKDAGVASAILLEKGITSPHHNQVLTFTGSHLLNGPQVVAHANRVLDSRIRYEEVPVSEFRQLLERFEKIGQITEYEKEVFLLQVQLIVSGKLETKTSDLKNVLGKEPTGIERFFEENKDAFQPGRGRRVEVHSIHDY
ncbi:hypothetical protein RI367_001952 [Sorochytrium milnesiophthora]